MAKKQPPPFDYDSAGNAAPLLRAVAEELREYDRQNTEASLAVGRRLAEAKEQIDEGQFQNWLKSVGWEVRTAQNMVRAAAFTCGRENVFALVPISILYILARDGVPVDLIEQVAAEFSDGKRPSAREVARRIAKANGKQPARKPASGQSGASPRDINFKKVTDHLAALKGEALQQEITDALRNIENAQLGTLYPYQRKEVLKVLQAVIARINSAPQSNPDEPAPLAEAAE